MQLFCILFIKKACFLNLYELYQVIDLRGTQTKGVIKMFKKITKEFLEENDINIAEDFNNEELER